MNKYVISLGLLCILTPCAHGMKQEEAAAAAPVALSEVIHQRDGREIPEFPKNPAILDESALQEKPQPAPAAETIVPATTKKSCIKEAAKKIAAVVGHAIYSPVRASRFVWGKATTSRPYVAVTNFTGKAAHGTRTAAQSAGHRIANLFRAIFGKLDLGNALQQYKPTDGLNLQAALDAQGKLVHTAHNYVLKRTFGFGALAALIGSGSAYRTFGKGPKTATVGLVSGLAAGLVSYATFRNQANIRGISLMGDRIVKRAIKEGVTAEQAEQAFGNSSHALSRVGISGLNAMRDITDKIKYWNSVDTGLVVAAPAEAASSSAH
ncbi:MAG TPA: hypothetical protein PKD74_02280 [Candidatus Dependentiae bacterium]|nr:hypothetical protein [Candidatus Dependentiae bacterium]